MPEQHTQPQSYDPPQIEDRAPIDLPLIGNASAQISAAFRPL